MFSQKFRPRPENYTWPGFVDALASLLMVIIFILMVFVLAALGLPGTTGFVGEFLVLVGAFKVNFLVAILGSFGVILAAAYILWLYKRVIFGKLENIQLKKIQDINLSEGSILVALCITVLFFGFYPDPLLETMKVSVDNLINNYNLEITKRITLK